MNEHSPACGKDSCPNLQPVTVLQTPASAAEGRPAFLAGGANSWLFPLHPVSQFWACGQASRAPCEGRAWTSDSNSPVPAVRSYLPLQEGLHSPPFPFLSASHSSCISSLCKDHSAKREMSRVGEGTGSPSPSVKWQQMAEALLWGRWRSVKGSHYSSLPACLSSQLPAPVGPASPRDTAHSWASSHRATDTGTGTVSQSLRKDAAMQSQALALQHKFAPGYEMLLTCSAK